MKKILALFLIFSVTIQADTALSSPKVSVNEQGQFLIQFTVNSDSKIRSKDIVLNEYQSDIPLAEDLLAFTLFEEEGAFDKFTIALGNNYPEDYFSFQLLIKNKLTKNVFIFLPSRYKAFTSQPNYSAPQKQIVKSKPLAEAEVLIEEPLNPIEEVLADTQSEIAAETEVEEVIIESSEITTIWSLASQIAKETDADIYQIMWAIFLANEIAFIDNNINLVRADIDLVIPSNDVLSNISTQLAKDSIQQMNSTRQTLRVSKNIQSLLTLTAPIDNTQITPTPAVAPKEAIAQKDLPLPINKNQGDLSPDDFIQSNTKTIELGVDNEPLEALQETSKEVSNSSSIGILDMLLVSLAALLAGFILAVLYIRKNSKTITEDDIYGFDNPADEGGIEGLPKGLSVKNDADTQQLDLASTYVEMGNLSDAKQILQALVKSTDSDSVKAEAEALLLKTL
jgi:FimV-like protein|tara:strand:- start:504 stop:1862 length:1359 start_codon:yes stop_codon:yes gene_type:complete